VLLYLTCRVLSRDSYRGSGDQWDLLEVESAVTSLHIATVGSGHRHYRAVLDIAIAGSGHRHYRALLDIATAGSGHRHYRALLDIQTLQGCNYTLLQQAQGTDTTEL
jgi:hypothetical protein